MSVFGATLVRILCGKMRTRITPNTDTFHALYIRSLEDVQNIFWMSSVLWIYVLYFEFTSCVQVDLWIVNTLTTKQTNGQIHSQFVECVWPFCGVVLKGSKTMSLHISPSLFHPYYCLGREVTFVVITPLMWSRESWRLAPAFFLRIWEKSVKENYNWTLFFCRSSNIADVLCFSPLRRRFLQHVIL